MSEQAAKLLGQVLALSADEQRAIRRALRDSRRKVLADEEARTIRERSDAVHNGTAVLVDGEQYLEELLRRTAARGAR